MEMWGCHWYLQGYQGNTGCNTGVVQSYLRLCGMSHLCITTIIFIIVMTSFWVLITINNCKNKQLLVKAALHRTELTKSGKYTENGNLCVAPSAPRWLIQWPYNWHTCIPETSASQRHKYSPIPKRQSTIQPPSFIHQPTNLTNYQYSHPVIHQFIHQPTQPPI